jgi:hypothetical protein
MVILFMIHPEKCKPLPRGGKWDVACGNIFESLVSWEVAILLIKAKQSR